MKKFTFTDNEEVNEIKEAKANATIKSLWKEPLPMDLTKNQQIRTRELLMQHDFELEYANNHTYSQQIKQTR